MKHEKYDLAASSEYMEYYFTSAGRNGEIAKIIQYSYVSHGVFNLGFGIHNRDGTMDDIAISNNGDMEKVLATVGATVYHFTEKYPGTLVMAQGSTASRTRLYRRMITLNYDEISEEFSIYGLKNDVWEEFVKNRDYQAFLVKRK
jgi:hypothetical protein